MTAEEEEPPLHDAYPHHPGYLAGCAACETRCHCEVGNVQCVYSGEHNGTAR